MSSAKDDAPERDETLPEKYAHWVVKMRWLVILFVAAVTAFLGYYVKDLDIRNDPDTLLPAGNHYVATNAYGEQKFGMGNLMVQAIKNHDLPLIQGVALVFCLMVLTVNFCIDGLYAVLNPRLRNA